MHIVVSQLQSGSAKISCSSSFSFGTSHEATSPLHRSASNKKANKQKKVTDDKLEKKDDTCVVYDLSETTGIQGKI